ncbi:hypothetical protein LSH36_23g03028 [Paralvinella palmiformis]|uniref:Ubiquitin-like protease family profile domain-containing protein n=1 Tax=Paralvinella palmiformis TaxID=53620 RepID=A0AAD9KCB4_9ANNE|nr:hypothetical protein LSH36_23g03028 [Paralvinella palmiformis]
MTIPRSLFQPLSVRVSREQFSRHSRGRGRLLFDVDRMSLSTLHGVADDSFREDASDLCLGQSLILSLLIYDRAGNEFRHYDSLSYVNIHTAQRIAKAIEPCLKGSDCGVYVLCMTEYLIRRNLLHDDVSVDEFVSPTAVTTRRQKIKELIYHLANQSEHS